METGVDLTRLISLRTGTEVAGLGAGGKSARPLPGIRGAELRLRCVAASSVVEVARSGARRNFRIARVTEGETKGLLALCDLNLL